MEKNKREMPNSFDTSHGKKRRGKMLDEDGSTTERIMSFDELLSERNDLMKQLNKALGDAKELRERLNVASGQRFSSARVLNSFGETTSAEATFDEMVNSRNMYVEMANDRKVKLEETRKKLTEAQEELTKTQEELKKAQEELAKLN